MSRTLLIFKHCSSCKYIALILFCLLVFQHSATMQNANSQQKQDATVETLEPDKPLERQIKGSETHIFQFNVKAGYYSRVEVEQKRIDVVVSLYSPEGKPIVEMDGKDGNLWRETVSCIAEKDGTYRVEVKAYGAIDQTGSYMIKMVENRLSAPNDHKRFEAEARLSAGRKFYVQSELADAIKEYKAASVLWREIGDAEWEAISQVNLGWSYNLSSNAKQAIESHKQAIELFQMTKDRIGEGNAFNGLGNSYIDTSQYEKAIEHFEKGLKIRQEVGDKRGISSSLNNLGNTYNYLAQYEKARDYFDKALIITREIKNRFIEGLILNNLGTVYESLTQYEKARERYEQALIILREINFRSGECGALNNLGNIYYRFAQYEKARDYFEKASTIAKEIEDRPREGAVLLGLATTYNRLGQYIKAEDYYKKALEVTREITDRSGESLALTGLGDIYSHLAQYEKARDSFEKALAITKEIKDRFGEGSTLIHLGSLYNKLAQHEKSKNYYEQALTITREIKDRSGESDSLIGLGLIYESLGQYEKAKTLQGQALLIKKEIKDKSGEAIVCGNLALLWQKMKNPKLAIIYGKQAVNAYQEIRSNIKGFDKETQKSFLADNLQIYRRLSDVLISEGRLPEAQAVLDLLKDEEYKQIARGDEKPERVPYNKAEADVVAKIENLADLSRRQAELQNEKQKSGEKFSAEKQQELDKIFADIEAANKAFRESLTALGKTERSVETQVTDIQSERNLQRSLGQLGRELKTGVVAIYTVIGTEDETDSSKNTHEKTRSKFGWAILVTPESRKAYPIDVRDLEQTVFQFRNVLSSDRYNPQPLAERLYNAIFRQTTEKQKQTLEADLEKYLGKRADKTLMWSLDGVLRYIPMAALHNGKQYLVSKYRHIVFSRQSLLLLNEKDSDEWQALGLGVSEKREGFSPLPGAEKELKDIVREPQATAGIFDGTIRLNSNFKKDETLSLWREGKYPVIHIASHYSFNQFDQTSSFLLVGDGKITFADIQDKDNLFGNVDLLALSACDTAMTANGRESESFAYLAQSLGAKSVIASLWKVSDTGTPELMIRFYKLRKDNPQMTKGEAFRQAQLSLVRGNYKVKEVETNRRGSAPLKDEKDLPLFTKDPNAPFAHPHYWAAFVLIGNWK